MVAFAAGETEQTVLDATSADADPEPDETVSFAFGALPPGVSAGAVATATVTIEDDDSLVLSLGNITQTGAEAMVSIPSPTGQSRTIHLRYRITTPPGAWSTTQTASTTTSSAMFDVTGLTSGTEYQIEVSLDSHFATGVTSATFTTLPSAVESLSVGSITRTGAAVTVNVIAANDSGVHLRYRKGTDTWNRKSQFVRVGETSATITLSGLGSGRGYTVEASYDREFPTATTESARFTTAPPSVDSVSVAKVSQTGAAVTVDVVAPNGDDVHLRYRIGGDDWSTESAHVNIGATSAAFPLSGLTSGADYEVEASDDAAFPPDTTKSTSFTTLPPSLSDVSVGSVTRTEATATVAIAAPNGESQTVHLRYRTTTPQGAWSGTPTTDTTTASATIPLTGLTAGTQYEAQASLSSDFAAPRSTVFSTLSPGPSVSGVSVGSIGQTGARANITIANPGRGQRTVRLRYRETPSGAWSETETAETTTASATIDLTGLTSGTQYEVQATLAGDFTAGAQSTTFTTLPPAVTSVTVSSEAQDKATVTVAVSAPNDSDVHLRYRTARVPGSPSRRPRT